jgi:COMPASS component SWD1
LNIVASFDRRGRYVFTGNSKGRVLVLSCLELELKASFRVGSSVTAVKSIEFARRGE